MFIGIVDAIDWPFGRLLWLPFAAARLIKPAGEKVRSAYVRQVGQRLRKIAELTAVLRNSWENKPR
jgi:hypothetical protein